MDAPLPCRVQRLGRVDYAESLRRMQAFTAERGAETTDEIWLLEHPAVYTLGLRARHRAVPPADIPAVTTDRGGDVTFHGPGQPIVYVLLDLTRRGLGVHQLVRTLEQAVIDMLRALDVAASRRVGAPGVYIGDRKIASLGLRVRGGRSYHGLALNAQMDLAPFSAIHPCGYPGLQVTQLAEFRPDIDAIDAGERMLAQVLWCLGYTEVSVPRGNSRVHSDVEHARR
jgi:lipoyl(octanoyl) transferase